MPMRSFAKDICGQYRHQSIERLLPDAKGGEPMTMAARSGAAIIILFLTISPSEAGPCQDSIDRTQARIDAIIAKRAGQSAWRPESIDAMRGYQPTPRSIAAAEGAGGGSRVQRALDALDRARAANASDNVALCNAEVNKARRVVGLR
jgi:hypothetical protein